jgi:hypothetical protein
MGTILTKEKKIPFAHLKTTEGTTFETKRVGRRNIGIIKKTTHKGHLPYEPPENATHFLQAAYF